MQDKQEGKIVIISSPSGGGKTSICNALLSDERISRGWKFSISHTTRRMRTGEQNGREYVFVNSDDFEQSNARGEYAEACKVHLYWYGTPAKPLQDAIDSGRVIILDVDVQGAEIIKRKYPEAITIFILPPSVEELQRRLTRRGTETEEQLRVRFETAREEMRLHDKFQYSVFNEDLDTAVKQVLGIIEGHPDCKAATVTREQIDKLIS